MKTMKEIYDELVKDERLKGKIFYEYQDKISAVREDGEELWSGIDYDEDDKETLAWQIDKDGEILDSNVVPFDMALETCRNNYLLFLGIE